MSVYVFSTGEFIKLNRRQHDLNLREKTFDYPENTFVMLLLTDGGAFVPISGTANHLQPVFWFEILRPS